MDEKKVREAIEWMKNERIIHKCSIYISPSIPKEQINLIEEYYNLAIEALEKQLPKRVENRTEYRNLYGHLIFYKGFCPSCGRVVESYRNNSCHVCTQRLDWSE